MFFLIVFFIFSEENEASFIIEDKETTFEIALFTINGNNLSSRNAHLKFALPMIIYDEIKHINSHTFTIEEIDGFQNELYEIKKKELNKLLLQEYEKKNNTFFDDSVRGKYEEQQEIYNNFLNYNYNTIEINEIRDLVFLKNDIDEVLPYIHFISSTADIKIYGELEEIEGFLKLSIYVSSKYSDSHLFKFETGGTADKIINDVKTIIPEIKRSVYGHDFSEVSIEVIPDYVQIFIDGKIAGIGYITSYYLSPGEHTFEYLSDSTHPLMESLEFENMESISKTISMEYTDYSLILVQTVPNGADVYSQGIWQGSTPLILENKNISDHLILQYDGYNEEIIGKSTGSDTFLTPVRPEFNFKSERELFYDSLAYFALSISFTIINFNLYNQYTSIGQVYVLNNDEAIDQYTKSIFFLSCAVAGLAVNTVLFIDMSEHLSNYLSEQ